MILPYHLPQPMGVMFPVVFVCLSVCPQDYLYRDQIIVPHSWSAYHRQVNIRSLSAQSWQYRYRRKPGTMLYLYFE